MFKLAHLFVEIGARRTAFDHALGGVRNTLSTQALALGTLAGNLATSAVNAIMNGAVRAFGATVLAASDLNETLNKTKEVFRDSAQVVIDQADEMAVKFGASKDKMLAAASSFGLIFQAADIATGKAASMSNELAKLAADASSFYNVPIEEALAKIQSGLVGQAEPLRAFGVLINESSVNAYAWANGIAAAGQQLTESQKIMARSALIVEGLSTASGDLERTIDAPANAMRKLQGTLGNLAADFGTLLLPAFQAALAVGTDLVTMLQAGFNASKGTIESWAATVVDAFGTVRVLWSNLPIIWDMAVVKFREGMLNIIEAVKVMPPNFMIFGKWLGENWVDLVVDACNAVLTVFRNLGTNIVKVWDAAMQFLTTGKFEVDWTPLLEGFEAQTEALPEFIKPAWVSLQEELDALADKMAENEVNRIKDIAEQAAAPAKAISAVTAAREKEFKSQTMQAAEFARNLQALQFGKDDTDQKQLAELEKQTEGINSINESIQRIATGGAVFA